MKINARNGSCIFYIIEKKSGRIYRKQNVVWSKVLQIMSLAGFMVWSWLRIICNFDSVEMFSMWNASYLKTIGKGQGKSHTRSVRRGVHVERTLIQGHRHCEVGWPVPFLAAFISPVIPLGPHLRLGGRWASFQPLVLGGSRTIVFGTVGKRSKSYATRPSVHILSFITTYNFTKMVPQDIYEPFH